MSDRERTVTADRKPWQLYARVALRVGLRWSPRRFAISPAQESPSLVGVDQQGPTGGRAVRVPMNMKHRFRSDRGCWHRRAAPAQQVTKESRDGIKTSRSRHGRLRGSHHSDAMPKSKRWVWYLITARGAEPARRGKLERLRSGGLRYYHGVQRVEARYESRDQCVQIISSQEVRPRYHCASANRVCEGMSSDRRRSGSKRARQQGLGLTKPR